MNKPLPFTRNLACGLALLLAGCSFVPDYLRPSAPVPDAWPIAIDGNDAARPMPEDWRAYFTDARLQALIDAALEHNRDLRISIARVAEARALAGLARADRFPAIDANLQRQAASTPADLSQTRERTFAQRFDANLGITAFELDFWRRVKSLDDAAQANFLASEYAQRAFRLSLVSDVASAWYVLQELDARAAIAEATVATRAESRKLIAQRRDVGLAGDLDYYAAEGAWATARAEAASLAQQKAAAENALRLLVGADLPPAPGASDAPLAAIPAVRVDLPSEVLLRRPDVLAAEQSLIGANANIGAARAAFLPRILLTLAAGSASPALSGLFSGGSGAWSFMPLLTYPLFDAGRNQSNLDLAEARKDIAVASYEKTIQQAFREVADLLDARQRLAEQAQALDTASAAQSERLQRVDARYKAGMSSYLELLDAQRELFTAQQSALAARRALATTSANLYKALGGG
ncbi:MAG: efflux transporter outer membrane subunit [Zoogloeaceae bacterium]|jgi:multidrug efflux system outer membrane protein|nr:efflux transporter outer membrane subunit [Zoogloeaceae bacterium]